MIYSIEHIVKMLKVARLKKGLSQRALSAKTGLPQSHISRIENGEVDLKISSLIEISRALDLELKLVSRSLIPTVEGLQRGVEDQERSLYQDKAYRKNLEKMQKSVQQVMHKSSENRELNRLLSTMNDLKRIHMNNSQVAQLDKLISKIKLPLESMKAIQKSQDAFNQAMKSSQMLKELDRLYQITNSLRTLRNTAIHDINKGVISTVPLYSLDEEDEDDEA